MSAESHYANADRLPWRDSPFPGVQWKKLHHDGGEGSSAVLLKFEPGASYGAHSHPEGESYYVLEGSLIDNGQELGPGSYVRHGPGSSHLPRSVAGCVLLVLLSKPIEMVPTEGAD